MTTKEDANAQHISDKQIQELREHFHIFDLNGSGWIEESDLKEALILLGKPPTDDDEIKRLFQSIDLNTDGRISFEEYIAWNRQLFIDDMTAKFNELDVEKNGTLGKNELKKVAIELGYGVSEEGLEQLTYEMDINQDGNISVDEFILSMAEVRAGQAYYVCNGELYQKKLEDDFNAIDSDGNGYVDETELRAMANKLAYVISEEDLDSLFNDMDENKDGKISLEEFIAAAVKIKTSRRIKAQREGSSARRRSSRMSINVPTTDTLTLEQIGELREHFHIFDLNGSGWIEFDDLKGALALLGQPSDDDEVNKLLKSIDLDTDGRISFDEYLIWNRQLFIEDMTTKFNQIDEDGDGKIGKSDLKKVALELGYGLLVTEEEIEQLAYEMDFKQNGNIDVEEFVIAMANARAGKAYYVLNGELYRKKLEEDFNAIDSDGNGTIDKAELRKMASNLAYTISDQEIDDLMNDMDNDKDGKISLDEFIAATVKIKTDKLASKTSSVRSISQTS